MRRRARCGRRPASPTRPRTRRAARPGRRGGRSPAAPESSFSARAPASRARCELLERLVAEPRRRDRVGEQPPVGRRRGRGDELVALAVPHRQVALGRRDERAVDPEPVHRREQLARRSSDASRLVADHRRGRRSPSGRHRRAEGVRGRAERLEPGLGDEREVVEREPVGAGGREPLDVGRELGCARASSSSRPRRAGRRARAARRSARAARRRASGPQPKRTRVGGGDRLGRDALERRLLRRAGGEDAQQAALARARRPRQPRRAAPRRSRGRPRARPRSRSSAARRRTAARPQRVRARLRVRPEQRAARRAEALRAEQPRPLGERLERERQRVRRLPGRDRTPPRGRPPPGRAARRRRPRARRRTRPPRARTGRGCGRPASRRAAAPPPPGCAAASASLWRPTTQARKRSPARSHASRKRSSGSASPRRPARARRSGARRARSRACVRVRTLTRRWRGKTRRARW